MYDPQCPVHLLMILPSVLYCPQLLPLCWLFIRLSRKYGVTFTDPSTLSSVGKLFAPTGELVMSSSVGLGPYGFAVHDIPGPLLCSRLVQ